MNQSINQYVASESELSAKTANTSWSIRLMRTYTEEIVVENVAADG